MAAVVQTGLANRGYYDGSIDGVIGSGTRETIRAFQKTTIFAGHRTDYPQLLKALKLPLVPQVELTERKGRLFNAQRGVIWLAKDGGTAENDYHTGTTSSFSNAGQDFLLPD
jgi:peptidoglycan hydrolase-like protein with peptidoglycan-binding domain